MKGDGQPLEVREQPLAQFQRLLALVGVEPKWAAIARDWIDARAWRYVRAVNWGGENAGACSRWI